MMRKLHRWPGLLLAILLCVMALSGTALSLYNAVETAQAPQASAGMTLADLVAKIQTNHPGLEQIKRSPSGRITAWWFDAGEPGSAVVDPATGQDIASTGQGPMRRWLTTLHRSLFLGDGGRITAAIGALAMLVLAISGAVLVARRTGGWKRWFTRLQGAWPGRLHTEIARAAVLGLTLSSATALWMTAETFDLISIEQPSAEATVDASTQPRLPLSELTALRAIPVDQLRELTLPNADDPQGVFTLKTQRGIDTIDAGTGNLIAWQDLSFAQRLSETIYMLHTGQGSAILGVVLGLMALGVPIMAITGGWMWLARWRSKPLFAGNTPAAQAETIVLVGSENGSTWGFAATLATALRNAGQAVHIAAMDRFNASRYSNAQRFLILTATYGEGDAPASAKGFLHALESLQQPPPAPLAVLGFGDRSFAKFCGYAAAVDQAARAKGWETLLPLDSINGQSPQDFLRWGRTLGHALGMDLELVHQPEIPKTQALTLVERRDYGVSNQTRTSILRFALPQVTAWQRFTGKVFARFEAGDLLGVVPQGSTTPRYYSLASGSNDGCIEIVVRKHTGGLCSTQLTCLQPNQHIQAFLQRNPGFHADRKSAPLLLIGAGTGIGPLAGFIRSNTQHRPVQLFFGFRHPNSDFLYQNELAKWQAEGRLAHLCTAVSGAENPQHVQDVLRKQSDQVLAAVRQGARIMVCGSRDMAHGVKEALTEILQTVGLSPAQLKAANRYAEDIY